MMATWPSLTSIEQYLRTIIDHSSTISKHQLAMIYHQLSGNQPLDGSLLILMIVPIAVGY